MSGADSVGGVPAAATTTSTASSQHGHAAPWPAKDIVYVAVVGAVLLAAFLEWILWLLAFLYCLAKVMQKAAGRGRWMIRLLAVINMALFVAMRLIFLPIMVVTLPLPAQVTSAFPERVVAVLQWFAFWSFAGLLTVPWLACVYQLVTNSVGRRRRIEHVLDEHTAPKMVIVMPCYNEEPDILLRTVDSLVGSDYPASCLHVFLSFDGDAENGLYLNTIEKLGVPLKLDSYPKSIDLTYRGSRITVSRFPHGGKRSCQKKTFRLIDKVYAEYLRRNDDLFILFIDSDCILDHVCIQNFMYEMELKPGSKHNMLAMTGVITSTTDKNSLITVLQDMEYIHGQLFERSVESGCGAVTCLPGALTCLRFSAFRRMAKYYFADKAEQCEDLFDYGKCHLGEDRWLTHLFMIGSQQRYQIQMNTGAFCKTEAVQTFKSLLKQRRRWFLGFITNEACMLTDFRLWKRYPLLCLIRLANNTIRTTALLFFIMVISIITTEQKISNLPVGFIAVSLGMNWVLMLYFGAKLGRYKIMLYPLMFVLNPFMNWLYMVYGIFTAGQRTWGGPRADAGKADEKTTPAQAVEHAIETGDELNVVPETFKTAMEGHALRRHASHHVPLQPSGHLEGRFVSAEPLPGGWYKQGNDSGALYADMNPRRAEDGVYRQGPRGQSADSFSSMSTQSVATPRRVESMFGPDGFALDFAPDVLASPTALNQSSPARPDLVPTAITPEALTAHLQKHGYSAPSSRSSFGSAESVPMHFAVPPRPRPPPAVAAARRHSAGDFDPVHNRPKPIRQESVPQRSQSVSGTSLAPPRRRFSTPAPPPSSKGGRRRQPRSRELSAGGSPLARKSFTRLAADEPGVEAEEGRTTAPPSKRSSLVEQEDAGRGRRVSVDGRGRRISRDRRGRKRLSKRPPGSDGSRGSSRG